MTAVYDVEALVGVLSLAHWRVVHLGMLQVSPFARTPFEILSNAATLAVYGLPRPRVSCPRIPVP